MLQHKRNPVKQQRTSEFRIKDSALGFEEET